MSLSQRELALTAKIGECMAEYRSILYADGAEYYGTMQGAMVGAADIARDGDINEFAHAVHVMQRMVMARCAQRMYPKEFGRTPAPVVDSQHDTSS